MVFCFTAAAATVAKAISVAKVLSSVGAILMSVQAVSDSIKAYKA